MDGEESNSRTIPALGCRRPSSRRIRVVLPAPLAPSRPTTSPRRTTRSAAETAVNAPKRRDAPLASARMSTRLPPRLAGERGHYDGVVEVRLHRLHAVRERARRGPYTPAGASPPGQRGGTVGPASGSERAGNAAEDVFRRAAREHVPGLQQDHGGRAGRLVHVGRGDRDRGAARGSAGD